ncbi:MAG: para-aminobenzoate synthetase / 4-amino-4-deoxychorismate lyase [Solirubrobacterales bacterium]|jgi:para-aminobenzoate synthetase/4-amino-4-deoxychorismate lyase|nr:para-aminobenzoate synthetase / 4-amino-4-deoxychorismate lyase [Solirubrobacterales bacterium]
MSATPHADPGGGVFETMLVLAGRPVELDAHIERLTASLVALYGSPLPSGTTDALLDRAGEVEHGKLRITVRPAQGRVELKVTASEIDATTVFPAFERGVALRNFVVEGGLGDHKWADRRLLERATAAAPAGELPLLVDADGAVLEASRGSVFAVREGRLTTPPTDGRILPSIARRQAIEVAAAREIEVSEERLTLEDLGAGEVFLAGSVRGIEPVRACDGAELRPPSEISGRIADGLRRRWTRASAGERAATAAGGRRAGQPVR